MPRPPAVSSVTRPGWPCLRPRRVGHEVRIDDTAPLRGRVGCDRYVARTVRGVDASRPSPYWIQRRLRQAGMRSISLAVDATNYVMLATGQPLHAFDLQTLGGPIIVRRAHAGERLTTLDDIERTLDVEDLLITDGGSQVLGIAGVMGGATSEVSPSTVDVLVEAAHFDQVSVARSSRRHKLSTEASRRFERGVDPELAPYAAELVVRLLVEHGGGVADAAVTDVGDREPLASITMAADLPSRLVGTDYEPAQVVRALQAVGARVRTVDPDAGLFEVDPPTWRPDLRLPVDLVEEVARLVGYDRIPTVLPVAPPGRGLTAAQRARRSVSRTLAEHGCVEVLSYPFVSPAVHDDFGLAADDPRRMALRLANPLSDEQPELRTSVLATLLPVLRRNVSRGTRDLGVFELGSVTRPTSTDLVPAPMPPVEARPSAEQLAAVEAAVPPQPTRVALALTGDRVVRGWWGEGRPADWSDAIALAGAVAGALSVDLDVVADADHPPWHPGRCAKLTLADGTLVGHAGELHRRWSRPSSCRRAPARPSSTSTSWSQPPPRWSWPGPCRPTRWPCRTLLSWSTRPPRQRPFEPPYWWVAASWSSPSSCSTSTPGRRSGPAASRSPTGSGCARRTAR